MGFAKNRLTPIQICEKKKSGKISGPHSRALVSLIKNLVFMSSLEASLSRYRGLNVREVPYRVSRYMATLHLDTSGASAHCHSGGGLSRAVPLGSLDFPLFEAVNHFYFRSRHEGFTFSLCFRSPCRRDSYVPLSSFHQHHLTLHHTCCSIQLQRSLPLELPTLYPTGTKH